ncbi:hypothetical protein H6G89_03490 [Oscillatoria sp. FACHB-1407]|uniref:hypothetical protein n=1 Tax=Oscillatoria sp. FACHB-1407 TaxID=2692847 RepID=UPI001689C81E|nr:hypothetical protein [Oscillatoria sp. FACHB-1407]MBD2460101.1 hypothetical protein [Oscillatoria sp. FACHB-1407]
MEHRCRNLININSELTPTWRTIRGYGSQVHLSRLRNALDDAEMLMRCPVKPEGIDQMVELLREAIVEHGMGR